MVLVGGLRLLIGLAFLGAVIAFCFWLLNRLFPIIANLPDSSQSHTKQAVFQTKHTTTVKQHEQHKPTGNTQEQTPSNGEAREEEMPR